MSIETATADTTQIITIPGPEQAPGAFDNGKITERKPIGMPHDRAGLKSVGPLFYWAWAQSDQQGTIALHPHQGFEILSYVLDGELNHRDTLGNQSRVTSGGAQVQQAGSGLSHEEITGPGHTAFFQIWLQPDLEAALQRPATYGEHRHGDFPSTSNNGVSIKTILGPGSPIELETRAVMRDVTVTAGSTFAHTVEPEHAMVMVTIDGQGQWNGASDHLLGKISAHDCTVVAGPQTEHITLTNTADQPLRFVSVEVPLKPGYRLYR